MHSIQGIIIQSMSQLYDWISMSEQIILIQVQSNAPVDGPCSQLPFYMDVVSTCRVTVFVMCLNPGPLRLKPRMNELIDSCISLAEAAAGGSDCPLAGGGLHRRPPSCAQVDDHGLYAGRIF